MCLPSKKKKERELCVVEEKGKMEERKKGEGGAVERGKVREKRLNKDFSNFPLWSLLTVTILQPFSF